MKLSDIVIDAIARDGLKAVASEIEIDPSALSRFQSGQGGLLLSKMDRLIEYVGVVIMTKDEYVRREQEHMLELRRTENALAVISEKWAAARLTRTRFDDNEKGGGS